MIVGCPYPIADLLPHAAPMVLLDHVIHWNDKELTASLTIGPKNRFFEAGEGVPSHIGIEFMAQACGAFAGLQAKVSDLPVRLGFLLSTRDFSANRAWFVVGDVLVVSVRQVFLEAGMAVFDCRIDTGDIFFAGARLTVFQPPDSDNNEAMT